MGDNVPPTAAPGGVPHFGTLAPARNFLASAGTASGRCTPSPAHDRPTERRRAGTVAFMTTRRVLPTTLAAVVAGALLAAALPAPAMAVARSCARHGGAIYAQGRGAGPSFRAWHRRGSLYICAAERQLAASRPTARTRRMGPWTSTSRLIVSGFDATWTVRKTVAGAPVDHIWTRDIWTGNTIQSDLPLVPAGGAQPARESQLADWTAGDATRAWVTKSGDVVMSVDDSSGDPQAHGALGPLTLDGRRLLVASYPAAPQVRNLGYSLHLFEVAEGDGDECDYVYDAMLSFIDPLTQTPLGVSWSVDSHNSLC